MLKMLASLKIFIAIAATAAVTIQTPQAIGAEASRCLIKVRGIIYLDEPCTISRHGNSTVIGSDGFYISKYFVYLQDINGIVGFWNGSAGEKQTREPLGQLTTEGECWVNTMARICAYR